MPRLALPAPHSPGETHQQRAGRLGAPGARRWAQLAARGEDIGIVAELPPGGPGMAAGDVSALASELAQILTAGGGGGPLSHDEISDIEAETLWPAKTLEEAEERARTIQAAARQLRDVPDDELFAALFPPGAFEPNRSAGAPASPGHVEFDGGHVHVHADYAGGQHSHFHIHQGDANHAPSDTHLHPGG